jgi:hypothetical protein
MGGGRDRNSGKGSDGSTTALDFYSVEIFQASLELRKGADLDKAANREGQGRSRARARAGLPALGASYTAILRGVDGTTGVTVVEVYAID